MWFQKKKQEEAANRRLMEQMSENLDKLQKRNEEISKQQQTDTGVMDRLEKAVSSMGEQLEVLKDGQTYKLSIRFFSRIVGTNSKTTRGKGILY